MTRGDKVAGVLLLLLFAFVLGRRSAPDRLACPSSWRPIVASSGQVTMGVVCYDKPERTIWLR